MVTITTIGTDRTIIIARIARRWTALKTRKSADLAQAQPEERAQMWTRDDYRFVIVWAAVIGLFVLMQWSRLPLG